MLRTGCNRAASQSFLSFLLVSTLASAHILATWDIKRLGLKVAEFKFDDVTSRPTSSQVR